MSKCFFFFFPFSLFPSPPPLFLATLKIELATYLQTTRGTVHPATLSFRPVGCVKKYQAGVSTVWGDICVPRVSTIQIIITLPCRLGPTYVPGTYTNSQAGCWAAGIEPGSGITNSNDSPDGLADARIHGMPKPTAAVQRLGRAGYMQLKDALDLKRGGAARVRSQLHSA